MSDGLSPAERVRIAVGFMLLAYALACACYRVALWLTARRMQRRAEQRRARLSRAEGGIGS